MDEITESVPMGDDFVWSVVLDCSLQGRIDEDVAFAGELVPVLEIDGTLAEEVVAAFGDQVRLKLVLDYWGFGWNAWLVLEDPDTGVQLLDLVQAEFLDPIESTRSTEIGEVFPGPWRENLSVAAIETACGEVGSCNQQPQALSFGIGPDSLMVLQEWQEGTMSNEAVAQTYRASVTTASVTPEPTCTDTTSSRYGFAAWKLNR